MSVSYQNPLVSHLLGEYPGTAPMCLHLQFPARIKGIKADALGTGQSWDSGCHKWWPKPHVVTADPVPQLQNIQEF